jgi:aquaporin NIP
MRKNTVRSFREAGSSTGISLTRKICRHFGMFAMISPTVLISSCNRSECCLRSNTLRQLVAEFVATFAMILFGTGAIVLNDISNGKIGVLGIALTFGVVITVMIYLLGPVSGAHMNPAVTLAITASNRLPLNLLLPFMLSQCAGAILASYLLSLFFPAHSTLGATTPQGSMALSFIVEFFLGLVLIFTILQIVKRFSIKRLPAAVIIGSIVALGSIFAGHISGASINPARSLAPAIVCGQYYGLWIYLVAPTVAGIFAVQISNFLDRSLEPARKTRFSRVSHVE